VTSLPAAPAPQPAGRPFRRAIHYWELRRIPYNLALLSLAGLWVVVTWPHFRPAVVLPHLAEALVLAGLANVCYSTAYLVELGIDSAARRAWERWRWALWLAGTLFALLLAQYWIGDEIYPSVR